MTSLIFLLGLLVGFTAGLLLNLLAYRLMDIPITPREFFTCPYNLVIGILTPLLLLALLHLVDRQYLLAYSIFFCALLVTLRTDLEFMLISRMVTLYILPLAFIFSWQGMIPISPANSLLGALFGYFFLDIIARLYHYTTKQEGMGQGDLDLLACIGAFTGLIGCWTTLLIGSITGACIGMLVVYRSGDRTQPIPFGPFLAFGAIITVLTHNQLLWGLACI